MPQSAVPASTASSVLPISVGTIDLNSIPYVSFNAAAAERGGGVEAFGRCQRCDAGLGAEIGERGDVLASVNVVAQYTTSLSSAVDGAPILTLAGSALVIASVCAAVVLASAGAAPLFNSASRLLLLMPVNCTSPDDIAVSNSPDVSNGCLAGDAELGILQRLARRSRRSVWLTGSVVELIVIFAFRATVRLARTGVAARGEHDEGDEGQLEGRRGTHDARA